MSILQLAKQSRSFRRFDSSVQIPDDLLQRWVDAARHSPSGANLQPLKYKIITGELCDDVFPCLAWAGYLKDWPGPADGERPAAYIVMLGDRSVAERCEVDSGIAAQTVMLAAVEAGFGGCMLGAIDRARLASVLDLPDQLNVLLVLALGKPAETVILEEARQGQIKYWRDEDGVHHVPKRPLSEILLP